MGLRLLHGAPVLGSRLQEPVRLGSPAPSLNSWSAKHCARSLNCTACSYLLYYYDGTRLACLAVGTLDFCRCLGGGYPRAMGSRVCCPLPLGLVCQYTIHPTSPLELAKGTSICTRKGDARDHLDPRGRMINLCPRLRPLSPVSYTSPPNHPRGDDTTFRETLILV